MILGQADFDDKREREHSHGGEAWAFQQLEEGESKVVHWKEMLIFIPVSSLRRVRCARRGEMAGGRLTVSQWRWPGPSQRSWEDEMRRLQKGWPPSLGHCPGAHPPSRMPMSASFNPEHK